MITTSPCQHCSALIEFDSEDAGQRGACPHCQTETILFIPTAGKPVPVAKSVQQKQNQRRISFGVFILLCGGLAFFITGGLASMQVQSVMHQIYVVLCLGFGALLFAAALLLRALNKREPQ